MSDPHPPPVSPSPDAAVVRTPGRQVFRPDEVEDALVRIERGAALRQSAQLRRLLRHLVTHAQRCDEAALREIVVGVEALGRDPATFDPKRDPIVRTEARRLRAKLADHYAGEGRDDPLVIELPRGGYVPVLRAAPAPVDGSIAVLPFANFTGDDSREPFCDALTDELIDTLARIEHLRVVARTSAFRFKETRESVRAIGEALGVRTLLEGSVQAAGERVRVLAQLVVCAEDRHLWSQAFEADCGDLALVQQTLADEIVRSLERSGALPGGVPLPRGGTRDAAARDAYERALAILRSLDVSRYDRARDLLDDALARDPSFARAHHLVALLLANRVAMCAQPAVQAMPEALAHLEAALAADAGLAQARALYAWIVGVWSRDWERAMNELRHALRDGPGSVPVRNTAGNLLALHGRFDEAEAEFALARERDPFHLAPRYNAALTACYARRFDVAVQRCDAIVDVEPAHPAAALRIVALLAAGRRAEASTAAQALVAAQPGNAMAAARLAEAQAAHGDLAAGLRTLAAADALLCAADMRHWAVAHVHAAAGDGEGTLAALERACAARESNTEATPVDPYFTFLHGDPRWRGLVVRHRLPRS